MRDPPSDATRVDLELTSRPESVTRVRSALSGLGEAIGLEPELLDDLKTAVSEACNNVVLHAYAGGVGPLLVSIAAAAGTLDVSVRDRGGGIQQLSSSEDRMGVGLAVISALTDRAEFESPAGGGTRVLMRFGKGGVGGGAPVAAEPTGAAVRWPRFPVDGELVVRLSPVSLVPAVLGRLCRAVAASSHFSLERFADLYAVADALGGYAGAAAAAPEVAFAIAASPRRLELTGGPFTVAPAGEVRGGELARVVDELWFTPSKGFDLLHLLFVDQRE
jgi:serine/threonine-protein kinase RsbW